MASERKTGAGLHLSGVLERSMPPRPAAATEPEEPEAGADPEPTAERGRGGRARTAERGRAAAEKTQKRMKGRTIYLPDDLFERILVQAHRKDKTISEYVAAILDRQVPDHRSSRLTPSAPAPSEPAAGREGDADVA